MHKIFFPVGRPAEVVVGAPVPARRPAARSSVPSSRRPLPPEQITKAIDRVATRTNLDRSSCTSGDDDQVRSLAACRSGSGGIIYRPKE